MELLDDVGHVEYHFNPFGDSVSVDGRKVLSLRQTCLCSEIILDATDGTLR
jgi:hypothetical protein